MPPLLFRAADTLLAFDDGTTLPASGALLRIHSSVLHDLLSGEVTMRRRPPPAAAAAGGRRRRQR